jgi:sterol desaturase/sphingolipid hydroxylase (fatty acid hydroxylase superfamily)
MTLIDFIGGFLPPGLRAIFFDNLFVVASTPIYIVLIGLEFIAGKFQHREIYTLNDTATNVYLTALNMVVDLLFRGITLVIYSFFFQHRIFQIENAVLYWVLLVVGLDFFYYWLHLADHHVRLFWAVHVTHHSSEHYNFTVGFRSSVFEPVYRFVFLFPLAWIGFKGADIFLIYAVSQIWGILVHTQLVGKLGILEWVLTTPSHHRVHHASNPKYLDKNLGMLLIIWDRIFGTFQEELPDEQYEPLRYGLTKNIEKPNPVSIVFHEWDAIASDLKKPSSFKAKWMYLFGPPGWSHDGSRMTSEQMRENERKHVR